MTEMPRTRVAALATLLAVVVVAAVAASGLATGISGGSGLFAADESATNETANGSAGGPGATLSGAVGGESARLEGEIEADTYRLRVARADGTAGRVAVLETMAADLEARLATLQERQERLNGSVDHPGRGSYLAARATVQQRVLADLATNGAELSLGYALQDEVSASLVERFRDVGLAADNVSFAADELAIPDGFEEPDFETTNWTTVAGGFEISLDGPDGTSLAALRNVSLATIDDDTLASLNESGILSIPETDLNVSWDVEDFDTSLNESTTD